MRLDTVGGHSRSGGLWFHQTCKKIKKFTSLVTTKVNRASNVGDPHYFHADPDPRCQEKTKFLTQFFLLVTFWRYIHIIFQRLVDPDPGGKKTRGSGGSGTLYHLVVDKATDPDPDIYCKRMWVRILIFYFMRIRMVGATIHYRYGSYRRYLVCHNQCSGSGLEQFGLLFNNFCALKQCCGSESASRWCGSATLLTISRVM